MREGDHSQELDLKMPYQETGISNPSLEYSYFLLQGRNWAAEILAIANQMSFILLRYLTFPWLWLTFLSFKKSYDQGSRPGMLLWEMEKQEWYSQAKIERSLAFP
jgi:hypothetical protein